MSDFVDWLFLYSLIDWRDRDRMKEDWESSDWDGRMELIDDWGLVDEYDEWEEEEWEKEALMDAKDW